MLMCRGLNRYHARGAERVQCDKNRVHFDVLQQLGSEVVFWFVAQLHAHSPLPIPFRSY